MKNNTKKEEEKKSTSLFQRHLNEILKTRGIFLNYDFHKALKALPSK